MGEIRVGTSGWAYDRWRGDFYPTGLPRRRELAHLAERVSAVELNGSFYALQRPTSYAAWRDATPDDFVLAVKGSRYITHLKRLRDVRTPMANFLSSGVLALGPKLGPLLWQLPESLTYDEGLMEDFYDLLPRTTAAVAALAREHDGRVTEDRAHLSYDADRPVRHVVEFRSDTFCAERSLDQMRRHGIGCVIADSAGRWPQASAVTSDLVYVRLHGHTELYASRYDEPAMTAWAERCLAWAEHADVHVYFDNDARGHAPHDAVGLLRRLDRLRSAGAGTGPPCPPS